MGLDDICNTTLVLGLGLTVKAEQQSNEKSGLVVRGGLEPCLSLGLSEGLYDNTKGGMDHLSLYRHESVALSLCKGGVVKREKVETERVSDEDDDSSNTRKKLRLNKDQSAVLEERFREQSTLNPKKKQELARKLNLSARQVEVWFQNRRARACLGRAWHRTKLKQTGVDCELLKKCCETLTNENRRLQKELQELKALKFAQPLYMPMPVETLTTCPSCERIGDSGDNKIRQSSLTTVSPKAHFLVSH